MDADHAIAGAMLALWGCVAALALAVIVLVGSAVFRTVVDDLSPPHAGRHRPCRGA